MTKRIDVIGQNGPTGEHYRVEQVARVLAFENMGTEEQWHRFISLAIKILEAVENDTDAERIEWT